MIHINHNDVIMTYTMSNVIIQNVALIHDALDRIYPLIFPHRKKRTDDDIDYKSEDDEEVL